MEEIKPNDERSEPVPLVLTTNEKEEYSEWEFGAPRNQSFQSRDFRTVEGITKIDPATFRELEHEISAIMAPLFWKRGALFLLCFSLARRPGTVLGALDVSGCLLCALAGLFPQSLSIMSCI
jgi:hypothetical protein